MTDKANPLPPQNFAQPNNPSKPTMPSTRIRDMRWWGYLLFGVGSLCLSAISVVFWMINPFTYVFLYLAAPAVRLLHYDPPVGGFSSLGSVMMISFLWPLTLAPLHWLNFRRLRWRNWGYAGLLLLANVSIAFIVLLVNAGPAN